MLTAIEKEERPTLSIPACRSTDAVRVVVLRLWQMVVYHIIYIRNIKTATGKVGGYEDIGRAVGKAIEGCLTLRLFQSTMKQTDTEPFLLQIGCRTLHTLTMVEEHYGALVTKIEKELFQHGQLILTLALNLIDMYSLDVSGTVVDA